MAVKAYTKKTTAERAEAARLLRERLERFEGELDPAAESEILAQFMGYSPRNAKLIAMQAADLGIAATDVAGFRAWKDRGRKVDKRPAGVPEGGWGFKILAPKGNGKGSEPKVAAAADGKVAVEGHGTAEDRMFFGTATVFDITQTVPADAPDGAVSPAREAIESGTVTATEGEE